MFYQAFLSTLSLRRATCISSIINNVIDNFYPRSPCGERRWLRCWQLAARDISIHALLAESDLRVLDGSKSSIISIHALLAESDLIDEIQLEFNSLISIHALLAESDSSSSLDDILAGVFLSTLSLRRAT